MQRSVATHARRGIPPSSKPSYPGLTPAAPLASHALPGEFSIRSIPDVMWRQLDWPVAAKAMEKWFALPAREMFDKEKSGDIKPISIPTE
ncbi:DUF6402 family protein [Nitrincola sp.]|uniref:DUF6402 family protein n=1 Tax=Nitrincola sp. TaxID=1926584 RepID=UPI003A900717